MGHYEFIEAFDAWQVPHQVRLSHCLLCCSFEDPDIGTVHKRIATMIEETEEQGRKGSV